MRRALELLAKLERQELDTARLALRAAEGELARTDEALSSLRQRLPAEHAAGWELPGGPALLASYLGASRRLEERLERRRGEQQTARERAAEAVRERLGAAKTLELAAEQIGAAATAELARRATLELEEASLRRRDPASAA
jgi:hypothetical protein